MEEFFQEISELVELGEDSLTETQLTSLSRRYPELMKLLFAVAENEPVYQFARYDGGVEGTEVGMTYFYTDLVAKAWPMEKGTGVPAGRVPGFISNLKAHTPLGHYGSGEESGRLWFGLREEAVRAHPDRVELGSLATRLFSLVKDANEEGKEIEPSYRFGRIMWWWDRHYQAMADYEPQYHRLDQLMRWGAAVAWLVNQNSLLLPEIAEDAIRADRHFFAWLDEHSDLKWHWKIPVVEPEGIDTEALLTVFSADYEDCGSEIRYWSGGISGPARERLSAIERSLPELDIGVARGGARVSGTDFSASTRAGTIASENVSRHLGRVADGKAVVEVSAEGRKVWSASSLKAWVGETAKRSFSLTLEASRHRLTQHISVQGIEMGALSATADGSVATVTWRSGLLDRTQRTLNALQEKLLGGSLEKAADSARGASLVYTDPATLKTFLRIDGGATSRWMAIEEGADEPGKEMAFRLGKPGESGGEPTWFTARFTDPPVVKNKAGAEAEWLQVEAGAGGPGRISVPPHPPGSNAEILTADSGGEGPKGHLYIIYAERDRAKVQARRDDLIFGLGGAREGSALQDPETLQRWRSARQAGRRGGDGYARAIPLSDSGGAALVRGDGITLIRPAHPWHQRVRQALREDGAEGDPLFKISGPHALLVDGQPKLHLDPSHETKSSFDLLSLLRDEANSIRPRGPPVYLESSLAKELLVEGKIPPSPIGKPQQIRVVTAERTNGTPRGSDILAWDRTEWLQPAGSPPSPEIDLSREIRLVYRSSDCEGEPRPRRCDSEQ